MVNSSRFSTSAISSWIDVREGKLPWTQLAFGIAALSGSDSL